MSKPKTKNDLWYVEMRGNVKGPFQIERIVAEVNAGNIKVIHRVSRDKVNFKAICNEVYFEEYVKAQLKVLVSEATKYSDDKTHNGDEPTGFANMTSISKGITEQLQHAENLQNINLKLTTMRNLHAEILAKRKIVIEVKEVEVDEIHPDDRNVVIGQATFWEQFSLRDRKTQMKLGGIAAAALIVFLAFGKVADNNQRKEAERVQAQAQEALHAKAMGDYDRAISQFQGVRENKDIDAKTMLEMADAYIQKRQAKDGASLVRRALKMSTLNQAEHAHANALLAQAAVVDNNYVDAEKFYDDSIHESEVFSSLHNMAAVELKVNHPERAEELLLKAIQMPAPEKGPSLMMLYVAAHAIDQADQGAGLQHFTSLQKLLATFNEPTEFLDHLAIEKIAVAERLKASDDLEDFMQDFVDGNPKKVVARVANDLDETYSNWGQAYGWCIDIYNHNRSNAGYNSFMAMCELKNKGAKAALPYAEYAVRVASSVSIHRGLLGYIWAQLGDADHAKHALLDGPKLTTPSNLWTLAASEICRLQPTSVNCNLSSDPQYATAHKNMQPKRSTSSVKRH